MNKIFNRLRWDYCTECNSKRSIECYDTKNHPIQYTLLLDEYENNKNILSKLDNIDISYMRCKRCGHKYMIDWTRGIPVPLSNLRMNIFMNLYYNYNK